MLDFAVRDESKKEWRKEIWPRIQYSLIKVCEEEPQYKTHIPYFKEYFFSGIIPTISGQDEREGYIRVESDGKIWIPVAYQAMFADELTLEDIVELFEQNSKLDKPEDLGMYFSVFARSGLNALSDEVDKRVQMYRIARMKYACQNPNSKNAANYINSYISDVYHKISSRYESLQYLSDDFFDEELQKWQLEYFKVCLALVSDNPSLVDKNLTKKLSLLNIFLNKKLFSFLATERLAELVKNCYESVKLFPSILKYLDFNGEEYYQTDELFIDLADLEDYDEDDEYEMVSGCGHDGTWVYDSIIEPRAIIVDSGSYNHKQYLSEIFRYFIECDLISLECSQPSVSRVNIIDIMDQSFKDKFAIDKSFEAFETLIYFEWPFEEVSSEKVDLGLRVILFEEPLEFEDGTTMLGVWLPLFSNNFFLTSLYYDADQFSRVVLMLSHGIKNNLGIEHLVFSNSNKNDAQENMIHRKYQLKYYPGFPMLKLGYNYKRAEKDHTEIKTVCADVSDEFWC